MQIYYINYMGRKKEKIQYKNHSLRVSDEVWDYFVKCKPRDKSWNLFIQELVEIIRYFKKL